MNGKKAGVEVALHATRAAVEEGIVPDCGVAYLRCVGAVEKLREKVSGDEKVGADIVFRALHEPLRCLARNAGEEGSIIVQEVLSRKGAEGYDVDKSQYVDMFKAGIIDPTK